MSNTEINTKPENQPERGLNPEAQAVADKFFAEVTAGPKTQSISDGERTSLLVPKDWEVVGGDDPLPPGYHSKGCRPAGNPQVEINMFRAPQQLSAETADRFQQLMGSPAHTLNPAEISQLTSILKDKAPANEQYEIRSAKTVDINGKRVLAVEGHYTNRDSYDTTVYATTGGSRLLELSYSAPQAQYEKYLPAARTSFASIFWKR